MRLIVITRTGKFSGITNISHVVMNRLRLWIYIVERRACERSTSSRTRSLLNGFDTDFSIIPINHSSPPVVVYLYKDCIPKSWRWQVNITARDYARPCLTPHAWPCCFQVCQTLTFLHQYWYEGMQANKVTKTPVTVKIGVLSSAMINSAALFNPAASYAGAKIVAIASRDQGVAAKSAKQYGIPKSYGSYEALLEDPEVEAVYISVPNGMHGGEQ